MLFILQWWGEVYELIGEAYVQGVVYGEAYLMSLGVKIR